MNQDGQIGRGELYWVAPDGTRGSVPGYPHPHLVVQDSSDGFRATP